MGKFSIFHHFQCKGGKKIWDGLSRMYLGGRCLQGNLPVSGAKLVTSLSNIGAFPEKQPAGGFLSFRGGRMAVLLWPEGRELAAPSAGV